MRRIGKIFLWLMGGVISVLLLLLLLLMIPSVQTYLAKEAASFLSKQMETEVSIDKLRVDFRLNILFENLRLNDQRGNNLISAKKGRAGFPSIQITKKEVNVSIHPIVLNNADVTLRRYAGDTALNIQFFVNFLKPKEKSKKMSIIDLQQIQLIDSRFQCRIDDSRAEDQEGVWNYRDIRLNDINLKLEQLLIIKDSLTFQIDKLSTKEHSGFLIEDLTGQLIIYRKGLYCLNTHLFTENKTNLFLDFRFEYNDFPDFQDFVNKVSFNSEIHEGVLNLKDLGYFVKKLQGMDAMVDVSTKVSGPISDFKIKNTHLSLGKNTEFEGEVDLTGLPKIEETFIDLNVRSLKTNIDELSSFKLPMDRKISVPAQVQNLQWVKIEGHFLGLYDNFFSDMHMSTALGDGHCELMLNARSNPVSYDGKVEVQDLKLGNLLQYSDLGLISAKTQIKGEGLTIKDMNFGVDANISAIEYKNNTVNDIYLTGNLLSKQFKGTIKCEDRNFDLDFNGNIDFNQMKPVYDFDLDVRAINLSSFNLLRPDSNAIVSAKIRTNLSGNNIDSMQGSLLIKNFAYIENGNEYILPNISLFINQLGGINQHIKLNSDVLDLDLQGEFTYKQILSELQKQVWKQLSNLVPYPVYGDEQNSQPQKLNMTLQMKKDIPLLEHFFSIVTAPKGLTAKLLFDEAENKLSLQLETPQLTVKNQVIDNIKVNIDRQAEIFSIGVNCGAYYATKTGTIADVQDFKLQSEINNNIITFTLYAAGNDLNKAENVTLNGAVGFDAKNKLWVDIQDGFILWDTNTFVFDSSSYVYISSGGLYIKNLGLYSKGGEKSINIRSKTIEGHELSFDFEKIDLGIFNMILNPFNISLEGSATGKGSLVFTPDGLGLGSDFQVKGLIFNEVYMGFLEAKTIWQSAEKKLRILASLYENPEKSKDLIMNIGGYFDPVNKYIDLNGDINRFNIKILERYLQSFASKVEGFGTGHLSFSGMLSNPKLEGSLWLKDATMGISFLKTEYRIGEGQLDFVDTGFVFRNVEIKDNNSGKGVLSGMVTHKRLRDWGVDLRIRAENMMGLNTTLKDNKLFYGKAYATGDVTIKGRASDLINIAVDVSTNPKTDITLSFDWATTVVENNFITFVTQTPEKQSTADFNADISRPSKMAVNLKINVTPDANVKIMLDPSIGGNIVGQGSGILNLVLDENDKFSIFGKYTLASGDFYLAYAEVFVRKFKLENGGTITWNGDPAEGIMHVRAVQNAKVSIANIFEKENVSGFSPLASVNNIITLNGNILKPNFSFTFEMPDVDERTASIVYDRIDTTNKDEMIRQMANVLFFGMFELSGQSDIGTSTINSTISYSVSELISSQVNKIVSGFAPNLIVRLVYLPSADGVTQTYIGDLEYRLFKNKLTIRTSFGMMAANEATQDNQFLGDVLVEYKLGKDGSWKLKGFNVTNQQGIILYNSKYSQGIGFSYSKDFDKTKDLFVRKKKRP